MYPVRPEIAAALLLPPDVLIPIIVLAVAIAILLDRHFPLRGRTRPRPMPRPTPQVDEATEAQAYEWITSL